MASDNETPKTSMTQRQVNDRVADIWPVLPIELRQRWWRETDYGRKLPSEQLIEDIEQSVRNR